MIHSKTQKNLRVFLSTKLKELHIDPSLVSETYAKQIHRSLNSETTQISISSFVVDKPTTEEPRRPKPSSTKNRSTTLKPRTNRSTTLKPRTNPSEDKPKKKFSPTKDDDDDNKNYESSKKSMATSTKEWKSYCQ